MKENMIKKTTKNSSQKKQQNQHNQLNDSTKSRKRGRPRKIKTQEELEKQSRPKLSLKQKQELKLKVQKQREKERAKKGEPFNKDRFYVKNKDLIPELEKWRDSAEKPEDRIISEELGEMMINIADKMLNRSEFRNYSKELKEDMKSLFYLKLIKGLKNYNFQFNNPFAFFTTAAWNAFLTVISKHYKQQNIKKDLMVKLAQELETYTGINPSSSLNKVIKSYIDDNTNNQ